MLTQSLGPTRVAERVKTGDKVWLMPGKGNDDEWTAQLASGGRAVKGESLLRGVPRLVVVPIRMGRGCEELERKEDGSKPRFD
jgi:hypothetical protein